MRIRRFCESKKEISEDDIIDCFQDYLDLLTNDIQDEYESIVFETSDINDLSSNQIFIRDGDDVMMVVDIQTLDYFIDKDVVINSRYEINRKDIVVLIVE